MHLLFALAIFLVLSVKAPGDQFVTAPQQLAYVVGGVLARTAAFVVLQTIIYVGARLLRSREYIASFPATRLNYLTLALLVLITVAPSQR